jgi:hypothetical protein
MDVHSWIELKNGDIFDPTNLDGMLPMMLLTMRGVVATKDTMVYEAYTGDELRAAISEWLRIRPVPRGEESQMCAIIRAAGYSTPDNCLLNTEAWLNDNPNIGAKRRFGRAGWRREDGSIWWEWG